MRVQNRFKHMINQSVKVHGVKYDIDSQGYAEVPDEIGNRLVNSGSWRAVQELKVQKKIEPKAKVSPKVEKPVEEPREPKKSAVVVKAKVKQEELPIEPEVQDIENMPYGELKALAASKGIKLRGNPSKEIIIEKLLELML